MAGCCLKDNFGEISPWNSRWFDGFLIHQKDVRYIFEGSGIDSLDAFTGQFRSKSKQETHESLAKKKKLARPWRCVSHIHPVNEDHGWRCWSQPIMENTSTKSTNLPSVSLHLSMVLHQPAHYSSHFFGSPGSSSSMARWFCRHRHISACLKAPGRQPVEHGAKFLQNPWYSQNVHMGKVIKKITNPNWGRFLFESVSLNRHIKNDIACLDSWVYSPQDSSDQQSYYMFSRGPYWLLLLTVTRRGGYTQDIYLKQSFNHPESPRCSSFLPNWPSVFVI